MWNILKEKLKYKIDEKILLQEVTFLTLILQAIRNRINCKKMLKKKKKELP